MLKNILLMIGLSTLLISCGESWDKDPDEIAPPPQTIIRPVVTPSEPVFFYDPIIKDKEVLEDTYLANLQAGDILIITVSGKFYTPMFSGIYINTYKSRWTDRHCEYLEFKQLLKREVCWDSPRSGLCQIKYRDYQGESKQIIVFSDEINDTKLRLKIGENLYPLGKIIELHGTSIKTEIKISKAMIQEANDTYLSVIPDKNSGAIRTGYIGIQSCEGLGRREFSHNGSVSTKNYESQIRREFKVSVSYKRMGEVNE